MESHKKQIQKENLKAFLEKEHIISFPLEDFYVCYINFHMSVTIHFNGDALFLVKLYLNENRSQCRCLELNYDPDRIMTYDQLEEEIKKLDKFRTLSSLESLSLDSPLIFLEIDSRIAYKENPNLDDFKHVPLESKETIKMR